MQGVFARPAPPGAPRIIPHPRRFAPSRKLLMKTLIVNPVLSCIIETQTSTQQRGVTARETWHFHSFTLFYCLWKLSASWSSHLAAFLVYNPAGRYAAVQRVNYGKDEHVYAIITGEKKFVLHYRSSGCIPRNPPGLIRYPCAWSFLTISIHGTLYACSLYTKPARRRQRCS